MQVSVSPLAERDLETIGDFIAEDNPARALTFIEELRVQCERIAVSPRAYPARPDLARNLRACPYGDYIIFFTASRAAVTIVRVLHGAMDLPTRFSNQG